MRKLLTFLAAVLLTASVWAQSPQKMSYQAVIRNSSNALVTSTEVGMRISILQGTSTGTVVYVETQSPTTNINGLASTEIGGGTGFDTIDWANGPYFIKTETDPAGGTNYTISGTSQLLSVPYALFAKEAESVTNVDITDKIAAGTNITITGDGTTASPFVINSTTYSVGDFAHGGIVIWVDETGQHGLVCAKSDRSSDVRWYAGTYGHTSARGDGPYSGEANTAIIIAAQAGIGSDLLPYAAVLCNETQITEGGKTYGNWYLPSKEELNMMYQNRSTINATAEANGGSAFVGDTYWSSTEAEIVSGSNYAWCQYFVNGGQGIWGKDNTARVRAIRAF